MDRNKSLTENKNWKPELQQIKKQEEMFFNFEASGRRYLQTRSSRRKHKLYKKLMQFLVAEKESVGPLCSPFPQMLFADSDKQRNSHQMEICMIALSAFMKLFLDVQNFPLGRKKKGQGRNRTYFSRF